jgi:tRNA threonylcarbamoyladenosine biosynthesis protein TsaB
VSRRVEARNPRNVVVTLKILALDTSTEFCSVALLHDQQEFAREVNAGQRHSELILQMVEAVLGEAGLRLRDLSGIAFGAGPGSFTGLRIACGVAQGLAFGAGLTVVPIGSLLALAQAAGAPQVLTCLDARMGEIYHAAYAREAGDPKHAGWKEIVAPNVCKADAAPALPGSDWTGCGSGFSAYPAMLAARYPEQLGRVDAELYPHARAVARLAQPVLAAGGGVSPERALPLYVRDKVAFKMHERR